MILEQKGTRMAEEGEEWNGLEMKILKSLANFFKMHEQWRSSFNLASAVRKGKSTNEMKW